MANLTRYNFASGGEYGSAGMRESANGEYVKLADIMELLQTAPNRQSAQCSHDWAQTAHYGIWYCLKCKLTSVA